MKNDMPLKPVSLKPGDAIGVVSPAGPVSASDMLEGLELLGSMGYRVVPAPHLYDRKGYLAGDDSVRLRDLHEMFSNPEVRAIICSRGGYGSMRLLEAIDYRLLQENPKIFVGYSDITALHAAINKKTGLVSFHGPVVKGLSRGEDDNLNSLFSVLSGGSLPAYSLKEGKALRAGSAEGRVSGGNLSLLSSLAGTPFFPDLEGSILFVEERGEPLYRIDRMLSQLIMAGCLKGVRALVAGTFEDCGEMASIEELLKERLSVLSIPLITGLPVGHGRRNLTLPLGVRVRLSSSDMSLEVTEEFLRE